MLIAVDNLGCSDTLKKIDYLTVAKPVAKINVTPPSGCRSLLVTFKDVSTDVAGVALTNFNWTFGDGGVARSSYFAAGEELSARCEFVCDGEVCRAGVGSGGPVSGVSGGG